MSAPIEEAFEPIWKDRKRFLGMPLSFTKYEITADRLITHHGLFHTTTDEILLYRILDIKLTRSLGQKILGVGTIILYSADKSHNMMEIKNIKKPKEVRKFISKAVEQERISKGVTGREIYGASAGSGENKGEYNFVDIDGDGIPD